MSTILELNNIKKAYDVKMAVDIEKLVIEEGDCVGLVGEILACATSLFVPKTWLNGTLAGCCIIGIAIRKIKVGGRE